MSNHKLKILLVNNLYAPRQVGGAEKSVQSLGEALTAEGHQVHVFTLNDGQQPVRRVLNGVHVHEWPLQNLHWPFSAEKKSAFNRLRWHIADIRNTAYHDAFDELINEAKPDVIHTHNLAGFSTHIWEHANRKRIPVVHTLRDYYLSCPASTRYKHNRNCNATCLSCLPFEMARRRASRGVDAVVGISQFILDDHIRRGFFTGVPIKTVIGNTARVTPFAQDARSRQNPARTFGYLGMLNPSKGVEQLLAAFDAIAPPDATLLIGGTGETMYVESLRGRYQHPGIHFLGFVDPATIYAAADVIVVPSLWNEPFSRVAMEAALHGIPLIASARGGLAEIASLVGGEVFDPDQPQSLVEAMRRELSREAATSPRGQPDADIGATFDTARRTEDYVSVYRRVAA